MPLYEYECTQCSHRFELKQRFDEEPVALCPQCGGYVRRIIFPVGIIFKGSGFYSTEHRRSPIGTVRDESDSAKFSPTDKLAEELREEKPQKAAP